MSRHTITAQTLARRIVQKASADVESTEPGALRDEPDGVHAHRTRVRRLRSILSSLERLSDDTVLAETRATLKPWGQVLGEARDAEVRAERAEAVMAELGIDDADARRRLVGDERAEYRHLHARVVEAHETPAGVARRQLIREAGLRIDLDDAAAKKTFRRLLRRDVDRLARAARRSDGSLDRLHDVRKAARRLRYLSEAVNAADASMLGGDNRRLGRAAKRVHTLLGEHRDDLLLAERAVETHRRAFTAQEATAPYDEIARHAQIRADAHLERVPKALKKVRAAAKKMG
ncbi:CHAD domain-containing protein [Microbacterium sp. NPDC090007]|uniref:CHAD domain-containing protein n=1 Tax=Microbacterium sp. NPDC090007 TaxID=3364204 RepID=UPI0038061B42